MTKEEITTLLRANPVCYLATVENDTPACGECKRTPSTREVSSFR